jgi:hypothetical protein
VDDQPEIEGPPGDRNVFWLRVPPDPEAWEAELPDGTRMRPVWLPGGRRLGFEHPLPAGTRITHNGHVVDTLT